MSQAGKYIKRDGTALRGTAVIGFYWSRQISAWGSRQSGFRSHLSVTHSALPILLSPQQSDQNSGGLESMPSPLAAPISLLNTLGRLLL